MKVSKIIEKLSLKTICEAGGLEKEVTGAYISDLLSDVMGNAEEGQIWITLQTHQNTIAVASLRDLSAIILVKDFQPAAETIQVAQKENIPLLSTSMNCFEISGLLYNLLKENNIV